MAVAPSRAEAPVPLIAKTGEGFLFARVKGRVSFPSARRTPCDALYELVAVRTHAQACSFLLEYGALADDVDFKARAVEAWAAGGPQPARREGYRSPFPLANPHVRRLVPFDFEEGPGSKSARRRRESACVDFPSFARETLQGGRLAEVSIERVPDDWPRIFRERAWPLCAAALRKEGMGDLLPDALESGGDAGRSVEGRFARVKGWQLDGRPRLAAGFFAELENAVDAVAGAHAYGRLVDAFAAAEGLLTRCEGQTFSDFEMYRDFFRALLTLMAAADAPAGDSRAAEALVAGCCELWGQGPDGLMAFRFPGLVAQGAFGPAFRNLDIANPFLNCADLPRRKRELAIREFRRRMPDAAERGAPLIVLPVGEAGAAAGRAGVLGAHADEIARFALNLYRSGRLAVPSKGARVLASGAQVEPRDAPLLAHLFEAALSADSLRIGRGSRGSGPAGGKGPSRVGLCACGIPAYPNSKYCFGDACKSAAYQAGDPGSAR